MKANDRETTKQQRLTVDLGAKLLAEVEIMRRVIQDDVGPTRNVSRGDVVRLALWRLYLSMLVATAELGKNMVQNFEDYMAAWERIQGEVICPDWLIPGKPVEPAQPPPAKKKGGKK